MLASISADMLAGISADILASISAFMLSGISADMLAGISADMLAGISADMFASISPAFIVLKNVKKCEKYRRLIWVKEYLKSRNSRIMRDLEFVAIFTLDQWKEQRMCSRFCAILSKSAMDIFTTIQQAFGDQILSRTQVFQWHSRFKTSRTSVGSDEHRETHKLPNS
jgi:hypothetical protein